MKDLSEAIEYKGKTYTLVCNLNVLEAIQEEYGSMDKWAKLTEAKETSGEDMKEDSEPDIKAILFGLTLMINEGLEIEAEDNGTEFKALSTKQVGRIISEVGFREATRKLNETVIKSTQSAEKNE